MFLHSEKQWDEVDLYLPGGAKVHYVRNSAVTSSLTLEADGTSSQFRGSSIVWTGIATGWELRLTDGTIIVFPAYSRASKIIDRNGNQITLTRSSDDGDLTQITSPSGRWIKLAYDTSHRVTQAKDNGGRTVTYKYDSGGRLSTVTGPGASKPTTIYGYDTKGRLSTLTDARGIVYLTNEYDTNNRIAKQTLPEGVVYSFDYTLNATGGVTETRVTQPNGTIRRLVFNTTGAAVSDTAAYGTSSARTTTFQRGTDQRVDGVTDPFGRLTSFGYDTSGRVTTVKELAGTTDERTTSTITYGPFDQPATVKDADGNRTLLDYDTKGNVAAATDPENRKTVFSYRSDGQLETVTDPNQKKTTFGYRAGGQTTVTDPLGQVSKQFVDAVGRVVTATDTATDTAGGTSTVTYDAANQPTKVTDQTGASTSFEYDENGNLKKLTDPRLKPLSWAYNNADQVQTATDQLGKNTVYTYDTAGRPKTVTSRAGRTSTLSYDPLNRPTTLTYGTTTGGTESSATLGYDAFDRTKTVTDTLGGNATLDYDVRDQLKSVTQARGTVTYDYDTLGRQHSTTVTGQPATIYGYDSSGLLTSVTQGSTGVGIAHTATGQQAKTTLPGGWSQTPDYDDAGRLKSITYANGTTAKGTLTYAYDKAGRVRKVAGSMANLQLPTARAGMVYNDANRLTSVNGTALTYDDDGNLTNDGTAAYTWNARGDLTGLSKTGTTATFAYDGLGLRSARTVNGTKTGFLNDGANTSAELDATNTVTSSLLSGGVDQWFARTKAGATDAVLTDAQGSPVALGAADGTMGARYGYDPYGAPTATGDSRGSDVSYTGRQDDGTGLMYYRARYYSPSLQRFISEDPAGIAGGTNLYEYAGGSPTNATDPSGNNPLLVGCAGGAAFGGGISYFNQRFLSGRKVDWGSVGGAALEGCAFGMLGGGGLMLGRTATQGPVLGSKLEYFFGNATGRIHNIERSSSMAQSLRRIGILDNSQGRALLERHLREVYADSSTILRTETDGVIIREGLLKGPGGFLKSETIWQGRKLITGKLIGVGSRYTLRRGRELK